ncbi:hypothetical protein ATCC90586_006699 [Pythium insidiosum]|nr:hypothetical protein ATCC90586_006699 [Pythium insidiosum]
MQQSSTSYMAEQADETTAALGALDSPHAAHLTDPEPVIQSSGADSRGSTADESLVDLDEADGEPVIAHDDVFGLGSSDEIAMNMGMTLHAMQQLQDELMARSSAVDVADTTPSAETQPLSRRDDKIRQFSEHPIVAGVSPDGRVVHCKCGKAVRLNPPWYILKYEQHLVSRNSKRVAEDIPPAAPCDTYGLRTLEELRRLPDNEEPNPRTPTLSALEGNSHFGRATPDGRFVECRCSELIILSTPWDLREFYRHVAAKKNAKPVAARRKPRSQQGARKPKLGDGAAFRISQRLSSRDFHWLPVSAHSVLPCPGIRDDERVTAFIASTTQITGGSRPRRRIAEELVPHVTSSSGTQEANDCKGSGHEDEDGDDGDEQTGGGTRKQPLRLSPSERLLVHDAIESEALWYIDRDAGSVRSLDCKGTIAVSRSERMCASCTALRANTSLRVAMNVAAQRLRKMAARAASDVGGLNTAGLDQLTARRVTRAVSPAAKHPVGRHFAVLEQAFSMEDEFARILRELFTAEVEDGSAKNVWFDAADMGIQGLFDSHPAYLGLVEAMMVLKDKERRGVGRQNMSYSEQLDAFMRTLSDVSPEACDFFQHHLGGRKQNPTELLPVPGLLPCRGLRDDKVQAYVTNAVQLIGGSRPKYVIARELFPEVFDEADSKKVTFWLRFAKMGLFGFMRSHPVFEGLVASMVEVKDKERRGVGKQNMQYAKALDDFMTALAAVSMDAFELFSLHFCGRTTRSQKVKKRKTDSHSTPQPESAVSVPIEMDQSIAMHSAGVSAEMSLATSSAMALAMTAQAASHVHADTVITVPPHAIQQELSVVEAHHLMSAEDLLGARSLSTADMEESQRLMDRMLVEVNLSVGGATSDALPEAQNEDQATAPSAQDHDQLDAQTYLDENGVLTTML